MIVEFQTIARCGILLLATAVIACQPPETSGSQAGDASADAGTIAGSEPTEEENLLYFLGSESARRLDPLALTESEKEAVLEAFRETLNGTGRELDRAVFEPKMREFFTTRMQAEAVAEREAGAALLVEASQTPGSTVAESGFVLIVTEEGTGEMPTAESIVKVHYHGTLRDGTVFDSSVDRGEPAAFPLNRVIKCWSEGVAMMKVGTKAKLICPPETAYGDRGAGESIPGGAVLTFEVELLEIVK